jgi:hypothetical protein
MKRLWVVLSAVLAACASPPPTPALAPNASTPVTTSGILGALDTQSATRSTAGEPIWVCRYLAGRAIRTVVIPRVVSECPATYRFDTQER